MESGVNNSNTLHKVFQNDPKYFKSLINKSVEIVTIDEKVHNGIVYVIDPVSESVVIINNDGQEKNKCNINIILGHAIKSMNTCDNTNNQEHLFAFATSKHTHTDHVKKKEQLKTWLKKHLIQVEDDGTTLKMGEDLIIESPYDLEHCFSTNTIILQRVQEIIRKMPSTE